LASALWLIAAIGKSATIAAVLQPLRLRLFLLRRLHCCCLGLRLTKA